MTIKSKPKFDTPMQDDRTLNSSGAMSASISSLGINGINVIITHMLGHPVNHFS